MSRPKEEYSGLHTHVVIGARKSDITNTLLLLSHAEDTLSDAIKNLKDVHARVLKIMSISKAPALQVILTKAETITDNVVNELLQGSTRMHQLVRLVSSNCQEDVPLPLDEDKTEAHTLNIRPPVSPDEPAQEPRPLTDSPSQ